MSYKRRVAQQREAARRRDVRRKTRLVERKMQSAAEIPIRVDPKPGEQIHHNDYPSNWRARPKERAIAREKRGVLKTVGP